MRDIRKRVGAILLCVLMVLTSIGVQTPQETSATATGGVGSSINMASGGTTDVTTYMGVHFMLVPYKSEYYAWENGVDIKTKTKGSVTMRADIKEQTDIKKLNCSKNSIYVGISSDSAVAAPTSSVAGTTGGDASSNACVKSYGWGSLDNIIKKLSGNNSKVISAWQGVATAMKACNKSGDISTELGTASTTLQTAFNKLEARIQSSDGQANNQNWMKKAFNSYNAGMARKGDKDAKGNLIYGDGTLGGMYSCENGYYLIIEPVVYIKRGGNYLVVSAQDIDGYMRQSSSSLRSGFMKVFTDGDNGITKGAYPSSKIDNLSSMLRQKDFKYTKSCKVKAQCKKGVSQSYGHNSYTYYSRGGYACIVPKSNIEEYKLYSVNQISTYSGAVGSSSATLKNSNGVIMDNDTVMTYPDTTGIGKDYATVVTGNYLVDFPDGSSTSALGTAVTAMSTNLNAESVKINWATSDVSSGALNVGKRWGINNTSTVKSSNDGDYFVSANSNTGMNVSTLTNETYTEEDADAMEAYSGETGGSDDAGGTPDTVDDGSAEVGEDEDDGASETDYNDINEADLTKLKDDYKYADSAGDYNKISEVKSNKADTIKKIKEVLKDTHKKAIDGYIAKVDSDKTNAENEKFMNYVPYSTTVVVNKSKITSYGYNLVYTIGDDGTGSISTSVAEGVGSYETFVDSGAGTGNDSKNAGYFEGGKDTFYAVAIKNSIASGESALNYVKGKLNTSDPYDFVDRVEGLTPNSDATICMSGELEGGDEVCVGAESTGNGLTGYTVVFIGIKGDIPLTGEEVLESYQLNNIDSDIASNFADQHHNSSLIFKSRKSSTYDYNSYNSATTCTYCNTSWDTVSSRTKSYDIVYKDASEGEHTVANDNSSLGTYLIRTTKDGGNIANRATLKSNGEVVDTSVETKKFTYAFNLVRALFESKTASSITANNGISTDVTGVLKMTYGNVPAGITNIDEKRNPNAFVGGTLVESLKWTGTYEDTTEHDASGKYRLAKPKDAFKHTCYTTDANGNQVQHDLNVQFLCKKWSESIKPFKLNKIPMENAKIIVTEKAHKYQTAEMATGKNENQDGIIPSVSSMNGVDANYDSVLDDDTRYAYLEKHNITGDNIDIYFYPEVKMMMYGMVSGVDSISDDSSVYKKALYTMGEQRRTVQSSSLYLYRISSRKTAEGVGQKLSGKIYSDDMTTNSAGKGDAPVIYAGGNVSLKVDGANMNLNLYGYAVDLVNKSKDGSGFKINDSETLTYKSIVDDESDVYANWGNAPESVAEANRSTQKLFTDYKAWVSNMADSNKYGADVTLQVTDTTKADGKKEYNNFSTTIGKVVTESGTGVGEASKEEGVYPIAVYNGKVVTSRDSAEEQALSKGYWCLVAQVQKDYNCDKDRAIKVLEDSGMFDAIYSAIESSTSKFNKSGKADSGVSDDTALLGSGDNWYDEVVKTFCIRRYVTETLHFDGTVLSDKIDYDAAPKDNSVSSGINDKQSAYNKSNAKWYISFYFKGNPNDGVVGSLTEESKKMYHSVGDYEPKFYNPAETSSSDSFGKAKNTFTVLTEKLHIDGADFIIPSSATSDESN